MTHAAMVGTRPARARRLAILLVLAIAVLAAGALPAAAQDPPKTSANYGLGPNDGKGDTILDWSTSETLVASGGTTVLVTDDVTDGAKKSLKLTHDASVDPSAPKSFGVALPMQDYTLDASGKASDLKSLGISVKSSSPTPRSFRLTIQDATGTHSIVADMAVEPGSGWQFVVVPSQQIAVSGWVWGTDKVHTVKVEEFERSGDWADWASGESFLFGPLHLNPGSRPKFILCADDGMAGVVRNGDDPGGYPASGKTIKEIADHYGFRLTAYIIPSKIETSGYLTWSEVGALRDAGWVIGSHSNTHPGDGASHGLMLLGPYGYAQQFPGASNDDKAIHDDIMAAVNDLVGRGFPSAANHFALPQGAWDSYVRSAVLGVGFKTVRGISSYNNGSSIPVGRHVGAGNTASTYTLSGWITLAGSVQVDGVVTLDQIKAYVDECVRTGATGTSYVHSINRDIAAKFDGLCAYLKDLQGKGLIDVVTAEEWLQGLNPP